MLNGSDFLEEEEEASRRPTAGPSATVMPACGQHKPRVKSEKYSFRFTLESVLVSTRVDTVIRHQAEGARIALLDYSNRSKFFRLERQPSPFLRACSFLFPLRMCSKQQYQTDRSIAFASTEPMSCCCEAQIFDRVFKQGRGTTIIAGDVRGWLSG